MRAASTLLTNTQDTPVEVRAERLLDKCTLHRKAGDVLRMLTPGGGGWGRPTEV